VRLGRNDMAFNMNDEMIGNAFSPSDKDQQLAKVSAKRLALAFANSKGDFHLQVEEESVAVPASLSKMLLHILAEMAEGRAMMLVPAHAELTTQEAADSLNVSRPFLVRLLEEGKMPFRKVGSHRRILYSDLMQYKKNLAQERLNVLEELQKDAQEKDMGY
jgi:excisionase family DNA binding protein